MARTDPTIYMRIPEALKEMLDTASNENHRSLTAEVVARLQASFESQSSASEAPKSDWSTRFDLYRMEAQLETLRTQQTLVSMQIQMLDGQIDQMARRKAPDDEMRGPMEELEKAKHLQMVLDRRSAQLRVDHRKQQELVDDLGRRELKNLDDAIDDVIQEDLRAVHELEERIGIPVERRAIVPKPKKPASPPK